MRVAWLALLGAMACGEAGSGRLEPQQIETELELRFDVVPARAIARRPFGEVRLRVLDQKGQLVVSPPIAVTLSLVNENGSPSFVLAQQSSRDGVIVFDALSVSAAGTIRLSATSPDVKAALSDPIEVAPAIARLAFSVQPRDTAVGAVITPAVEVELVDATGARVVADDIEIELDWLQHGTLTGDPSSVAVTADGVARFAELRGSKTGDGFSLTALAAGLGTARSQTFSLLASPAVSLRWIHAPPRSIPQDQAMTFSVELIDQTGQRALMDDREVIVEVIEGSVPLRGMTGEFTDHGIAIFNNLSYPLAEQIRLAVSSAGVEPLISEPIFVYALPEDPIRAAGESGVEPFAAWQPSLSYDGRRLGFVCSACSASNTFSGPWVIDFDQGTNEALNTTPSGEQPDNWDASPFLTRDGTKVAFISGSTNYVMNDVNGFNHDAYFRDLATGAVELIGVDPQGAQFDVASYVSRGATSDDGNLVAFMADYSSSTAPSGFAHGVYLRDRANASTRLIAEVGTGSFYTNTVAALSADGTMLLFDSPSDLLPEDQNRVQDIYISDLVNGSLRRISTPALNIPGDGASWGPQFSRDGKVVVFVSGGHNFVAGDTNAVADIFVADLALSTIERVSVSSSGGEASATVSMAPNYFLTGSDQPVISDDGRFVAFISAADNLVEGDTNGVADVFVHDRLSKQTLRVNVSAGGVEGNEAAIEVAISGDGRTIAFATFASNVVLDDANGNLDLFIVGNPLR